MPLNPSEELVEVESAKGRTPYSNNMVTKITKEQVLNLQSEIRRIYLNDSRPWVIGYSGGKDSSCVLQLVWYALKELPKDQFIKPVYVISSDTLVETPAVVNQLEKSLLLLGEAAKQQELPIEVHKVVPEIKDTFWVNMIGRGIPAPSVASNLNYHRGSWLQS